VCRKRFLTRLSSGVLVVAVTAGGVLLIGGVSHAAPLVAPQHTTTQLTTSPASPVTQGNPVTLTATITPTAAAGTIQFKDGTADLGNPVVASNGAASATTSELAPGSHQLTAVFTPTTPATYSPSTSPAVTFVITAATVVTAPTVAAATRRVTILTQSTASIDLLPFPKVELAAKLTDAVTGEPVMARMIDFYGGGQELCQAPTDMYGWVHCSAAENFGPQTVNEIVAGYEAVFSGDRDYGPSSQHASATIGTNHAKP
jgi:Bacterial Ig-like domain (group 3)